MFKHILYLILFTPLWCYAGNVSIETYIPKNAYTYMPMLKDVQNKIWDKEPIPYYVGGLIEQESCYTLTSSTCWTPKAKLLTSREEGAGFGQLTRTFTSNGSIRFDTLGDLKKQYSSELQGLTWDNIYGMPKLQLTAIVLYIKKLYGNIYYINTDNTRYAFTDSSYNGGYGAVISRRRICGMQKNCDPNIWFNNVENVCYSTRIVYGRSVCDINNQHVHNVLKLRMGKYEFFYQETSIDHPETIITEPIKPIVEEVNKSAEISTNDTKIVAPKLTSESTLSERNKTRETFRYILKILLSSLITCLLFLLLINKKKFFQGKDTYTDLLKRK